MDSPIPAPRPRSTTSDVLLDKLVSESADTSKFYVQTEEVGTLVYFSVFIIFFVFFFSACLSLVS